MPVPRFSDYARLPAGQSEILASPSTSRSYEARETGSRPDHAFNAR